MIIGITPSVKEIYKNQFEYCVDINLIKLIRFIFKKAKILIINDEIKYFKKLNFIILSGGNDIYKNKKLRKNKIRNELDRKILTYGVKRKIPVLGLCYGAQFISYFFGNKILKVNGHVNKKNTIFFKKKIFKKKQIKIKCFHHYSFYDYKKFETIGVSKRKNVEFFKVLNQKIYGIMWHPEREPYLQNFHKKLIKKICNS